MNELRIKLQPKQELLLDTVEKTPIVFYGGAKGGGKSKGLQLLMLYRRFAYPNSTGAIFRRTYPELEANHIRPLFQAFPQLREFYQEAKKLLSLPNGSELQFCHCKNEADISLYQGREFHDLSIDEAGQWTEAMFRTLLGSNRSSNPNIKPRCILTGNPGGLGHGWLKRIFIDQRFNEREKAEDYAFIQARVDDNAALMDNDPEYVRRLESEPNEALRKAYRFGDWNIFAGQFFQEISKEVHFIEPFQVPPHWNRFGAYDYGFNHPAAFGWFASDEDGNCYLYRELIRANVRVDLFAKELNEYPDTTNLYPIIAGHDCWTQKSVLRDDALPPTIAEQFATHAIYLKKAVIDRVQGAAQLRDYLAWQRRPNNKPRFYIFNTCPITFDCLSRMIHNPDKAEDVLKVDAAEGDPMSGDDAYDMVRYGLMSRPAITDKPAANYAMGSPGWYKQQSEDIWEREREKLEQESGMNTDWPESSNY